VPATHVVGISMGGMIAQQLALDHPDRVRSLSLLCTSPGGSSGGVPWRLLASAALRPLFGHERTWGIVSPALYGEWARREMPDRLAEDLEARGQEATPALTAWAQMAGIARWDVRDRLAQLAPIPTLVVHGDADALVPVAGGREIAARIPSARLVILPGMGHLLTTEAEAEVAAALLAHLDGAAQPAQPATAASA
jgi:pimeloyl-ACP methyl ester carboxylesterase